MVACASFLLLMSVASGCTSTSTVDIDPALAGGCGAQDIDTYPNLNIPPKVAAPQFTEDQKVTKLAELQAAKRRNNSEDVVAGVDLKTAITLARARGVCVLKVIENKCDSIDFTCD